MQRFLITTLIGLICGSVFLGLGARTLTVEAAIESKDINLPWCLNPEICDWSIFARNSGDIVLQGVVNRDLADTSHASWADAWDGTGIEFQADPDFEDPGNPNLVAFSIWLRYWDDLSTISYDLGREFDPQEEGPDAGLEFNGRSIWFDSGPGVSGEAEIWLRNDVQPLANESDMVFTLDLCSPLTLNLDGGGTSTINMTASEINDMFEFSYVGKTCTDTSGEDPGEGEDPVGSIYEAEWINQATIELTDPENNTVHTYIDPNIAHGPTSPSGDKNYSYNDACGNFLFDFDNDLLDTAGDQTVTLDVLNEGDDCNDIKSTNVSVLVNGENGKYSYVWLDAHTIARADYHAGAGEGAEYVFNDSDRASSGNAYLVDARGLSPEQLYLRSSESGDSCQDVLVIDSTDPSKGTLYIQGEEGSGAIRQDCSPAESIPAGGFAVKIGDLANRSIDEYTVAPPIDDTTINQPSCEGDVGVLGWILCPVATYLLEALDGIIGGTVTKGILNFELTGDQRDALENVWTGFRSIANIGFIIAFFITIYSAATGGILSSYDVKRLLPRLLVGAVAVQLSFFITMELADIFKALGDGVTTLILAPLPGGGNVASLFSDNPMGQNSGINSILNWAPGAQLARVAVSILIIVLVIIAAVFAISGILLMIIVFLLRNMALMVLMVISPLAFVAWIMPNTEGMFRKWWNFYIQLLALYPIAMAFLASGRLMASIWATGDNNWVGEIVGTIAMFAPYFMAPKLFSFAGSAVGGIVKGVNNAKGSIKDRTGKLRNTQMGKRLETGARAGLANRVNSSGGRVGRAARSTAMGRRYMAQQLAKQNAIEAEDTKAAAILDTAAVAGMTNAERRAHRRGTVMNRNAAPAEQIAALEQMLIDNDIDGIEQALTSGNVSQATWRQFMDKKGTEVHAKARHLSTGNAIGDRGFAPNFSGAATSSAEALANMRPETIQSTIADLQARAIAGDAGAEADLAAMLNTYTTEVATNDQLRGKLSTETHDLFAGVRSSEHARRTGGTARLSAGEQRAIDAANTRLGDQAAPGRQIVT